MVEKIKEKVKKAKHIDEEKKSVILEKIEEWRHDKEAVSLIPNLLMKYYEKEIKPILDELGLTD
jgi:undecaprenyl pyrophosphate synthase